MGDSHTDSIEQKEILKNVKTLLGKINLIGKIPDKKEALQLLKRLDFPRHIINHQLAVMRKALKIAHRIGKNRINIDLIRAGALLHDIGRFRTHELGHIAYGGDLLRELKFPEALARIAETHSLGGITREEAQQLNLPIRDYQPITLEEKVVCLADKYISGTEKVSIEDRFNRWIEKFGKTEFLQEQIRRVRVIEEEILRLIYQ